MRKFTYLVPKTLDEAISLHESYGERSRYVAGGTDVLAKIKEGKMTPDYLISLKHIVAQDRTMKPASCLSAPSSPTAA